MAASAQNAADCEFQCGDLYYKICQTGKKDVEVVRRTGEYKKLSQISVPDKITVGQTQYKVVKIGDGAFMGCANLKAVSIGSQIKEIGEYAFDGCTGLSSITIPKSVKKICDLAFEKCTSLTQVSLQKGLVHIGSGSFGYCTALTEIYIPASVKTIEAEAFYGCSSLTTARLSKKTKYTDSGTYSNDDDFEYSAFDEGVEIIVY